MIERESPTGGLNMLGQYRMNEGSLILMLCLVPIQGIGPSTVVAVASPCEAMCEANSWTRERPGTHPQLYDPN